MNLSPMAQATLLLTSYFSKANNETAKPLSNAEWGRFAVWLKDKGMTPADLLATNPGALLNGWQDSRITSERVLQLLGRGHSLALAVEKWQRAGLWVITRSDPEYPKRLKVHLKTDSPPVLFGCGEKSLLNTGGLAVVGSRNANEQDLAFTRQTGARAASEQIAIVSGAARGVDETAMLGAMHAGGTVIGVMADSLLKAATSAKWRKGLMDGNVVLVSPFYPEAGFSAGNAMARNKYIYCLADSALVIHSGMKGGTLNGAEENLKKDWVPLWVKPTDDPGAANARLVASGGRWCDANIETLSIASLLARLAPGMAGPDIEQPDMFAPPRDNDLASTPARGTCSYEERSPASLVIKEPALSAPQATAVDFYSLFLQELKRLTVEPATSTELAERTGLHNSQISVWLQRALDDKVISKLTRPVRYQLANNN